MRVMMGWSGEVSNNVWRKLEVDVDETDYQRMLAEVGISVEAQIPTNWKFLLMEAKATELVASELMSRFQVRTTEVQDYLAKARADQVRVIKKIKGEE